MKYVLSGVFTGATCNDCTLPVSNGTIRVYPAAQTRETTALAAAASKETFHQLSDEERKNRQQPLAEAALDAQGQYTLVLDEQSGYSGGALEVDWYCGTGPVVIKLPPKGRPEQQFHITTLQPQWRETREGSLATFDHHISPKWYCRILSLFDIWVICGQVIDCKTKKPVSGVKVLAFDVDILQDDELGFAYTNGSGRFTIVYPGDKFRQTLLSPWLNIEWPAGPDYYFRIESASGDVLLQEPRSTGHRKDRENASHCFCVNFCLEDVPVAGDTPWFTAFGNFAIVSDIDGNGRTTTDQSGAGGVDYGFFSAVKLKGYATKRMPGTSNPLYYRFLFSLDGTNFNPVTETHISATSLQVSQRQITWNGNVAFQNVVIDKTKPASPTDTLPPDNFPATIKNHVLRLDANGWVRVDQVCMDNGFFGPLLYVDTATIAAGGNASAGITPGNLPTAAQQKTGSKVWFRFQTTDDVSNATAFNTQSLEGMIYVNNWEEVTLVRLEELFAGGGSGCTPVTTHAHIAYTAQHELLAGWSFSAWSSAIPGGISGLPAGGTSSATTFDLATLGALTPPFSAWPSCAYSITLHTQRRLTTGEWNDDGRPNQIIFCK